MSISKTTDGGTSWIRHNGSNPGATYCLAVNLLNPSVVYAGGYENSAQAIYKTTDEGNTWFKLSANGLSGYVNKLAIDPVDTNVVYAGTTINIYKSTDGGNNWSNTSCPGGYTKALIIDPLDPMIIYAGTLNNGVYKSTNSGGVWTAMNEGLGELRINCMGINPNNYLFAGTEGGSMYRWPLGVGVLETKPIEDKTSIISVTPNPTKNRTVFTYSLTRATTVNLSIYDIQGRLVRNLVHAAQSQGTHSISWDGMDDKGKPLSGGIYFCRLETDGAGLMRKLVIVR